MPQVRNGYIVGSDGYLIPPGRDMTARLRVRDVVALTLTMLAMGAALLFGKLFDNSMLFLLLTGVADSTLGFYNYANKERKYPEEKIRGLLVPLAGVFVILMSLAILFVPVSEGVRDLIICIFVILGMLLTVAAAFFCVAQKSIKKKRCTENVIATCIGLVRHFRKGGDAYCPVWEFYFEGRTVTCMEKIPSAYGVPHTGDIQLIYVNPDDADDIYRPDTGAGRRWLRYALIISVSVLAIVLINIILLHTG